MAYCSLEVGNLFLGCDDNNIYFRFRNIQASETAFCRCIIANVLNRKPELFIADTAIRNAVLMIVIFWK